jgi:hypothetical protein
LAVSGPSAAGRASTVSVDAGPDEPSTGVQECVAQTADQDAWFAAHPWATTTPDPRLRALAAREVELRHEAKLVRKAMAARWARYQRHLKTRRAEIARVAAASAAAATAARQAAATAAAPAAVQVVNLSAHVITRTS